MSNAAVALSPEVIALLQSSYGRNADEVVKTIVQRNAPKADKPSKPSKLRAVKAQAETTATPKEREPVPAAFLPIALPPVGTYDATTFLAKSRAMGPIFMGDARDGLPEIVAERNGFSFVQRRDAAMALIAGFCGFDRCAPFGIQWDNAHIAANRALRPCKIPAPVSASHTVRGYVSGMPNGEAKRRADIEGRIRLSEESILKLEAMSTGEATPEMVKELASMYECPEAMVERTHFALLATERKIVENLRAQLHA